MVALADRMKEYEETNNFKLVRRIPTIIRVDGRAFHTYTRYMNKPFDELFISNMVKAAQSVAEDMQGFKLGYHQSDEVSFLLTDYDNLETQPWLAGRVQKLVSIVASSMTAQFDALDAPWRQSPRLPTFDARVFQMPIGDVANYFLWRMRDWKRNSIMMFARAYMPHKEIQNKNTTELLEILDARGLQWTHLSSFKRQGTFFWNPRNERLKNSSPHILPEYDQITPLIRDVLLHGVEE